MSNSETSQFKLDDQDDIALKFTRSSAVTFMGKNEILLRFSATGDPQHKRCFLLPSKNLPEHGAFYRGYVTVGIDNYKSELPELTVKLPKVSSLAVCVKEINKTN